jgi:uncharacterized protein (TIGR03437 family)
MKISSSRGIRLLAATGFLIPGAAWCAHLQATDTAVAPGSTVEVPITLASDGAAVAALQFDLEYDPSAMSVTAMPGNASRSAAKHLYSAELAPNKRRIIIVGWNQTTIQDHVVVRLLISARRAASPSSYNLSFSNMVAAGADGQSIPLDGPVMSIAVSQSEAPAYLIPERVLNAASLTAGPIAPGQLVSLFGPGTGISDSLLESSDLAILFNAVAAPVLFTGENQINAAVPFGIEGSERVQVELQVKGAAIHSVELPVTALQPGIFTQDATGIGLASILNEDSTLNSLTNPAAPGSVVTLYATGLGQTDPPGTDGQIASETLPLKAPVSATIGGVEATVVFAGTMPGSPAGIVQIRVRVPEQLTTPGFASITVQSGPVASQPGVLIALPRSLDQ